MLKTEIEAKFLDVDAEDIRAQLKVLEAERTSSEILMKRATFDFADRRLNEKQGWVRLRDEGTRVTLTYKQENNASLTGMLEAETVVHSYEAADAFLRAIGLEQTSFQESRRETWKLGETEITIDTWPWLPTFVEIEGPTEDTVRSLAQTLGFAFEDALHGGINHVYTEYYKITKELFLQTKVLRFETEKPEWVK